VSGGGGKGGSSSSTVSIPPEVLARYNAVNAQAEKLGGTDAAGNPNTPFKPYSNDPNAFVAPLTPTQQSGIANTNASAGAAQPWYQQAGGLAAASAQNVNPQQYSSGQIAQYMNPFAQQVVAGTLAPQLQQQAIDRQNLTSSNIRGGAFGGDRAAISDAVLRGQQEQATGATVAGLLNPMYNQAQQEFNTQQGVNLAAQQANRQNYQTAAGLLGNLGTGAQTAALTGAQAQLSAGQQQQQTQQAGLTALYNQFLQQQSYPFQTTQFLANIAEGTGALSGSTTTGQQSGGFFSDERVKEDIEQIGETYDGQKIIKFRYKGDKGPKQIGLSAQDVEKHHPHAVGNYHGIKTVNYDEATKDSAHRGHFYSGGLASMGGAALDTGTRQNFDLGGSTDQSALLAQLGLGRQLINPYGSMAGQQSAVPTQRNIMTGGMGQPKGLMQANLPQRQPSGLSQASSIVKDLGGIGSRGNKNASGQYSGGSGLLGAGQGLKDWMSDDSKNPTPTNTTDTKPAWRGGRAGYALDGEVDDQPEKPDMPDLSKPTEQFKPEEDDPLAHQGKMTIPDDNPQAKLNPAQLPSGGGSGGGLGSILSGAGSFMSGASKIAPFFLASGGLAGEREHHAVPNETNNQSNVAGDGGGSDEPQYKIQPQNLEDMPEHRQNLIKAIYAPESGGRYDVLNGGETFDNTQQHPNRVGKGGESTAAGAGQFTKSTWDDVTGNAPMTKPYMDSATWTLAARDYNKRTGKDLDADLQKNGVTPEIKAALSDTWTGLKGPGPNWRLPTTAAAGVSGGKKPLAPLDEGALGAIQKIPGIGSLAKSEEQGGLSEQTKLALLGGLGGMLASPNRSFLGALGSGISSGVETYQGMGGLGVQQKQADTQARSADYVNAIRAQSLLKGSLFMLNGKEVYITTKGLKNAADVTPEDEILGGEAAAQAAQRIGATPVSPTGGATSATSGTVGGTSGLAMKPAQPDTTEYNFLGDAAKAQLQKDNASVFRYGDAATRQDALLKSSATIDKINSNADDARRAGDTLNQLAELVAKAPNTGPMSLGPLTDKVSTTLGFWNDLARKVGIRDENGNVIEILPKELGEKTAQSKIATLQQFQQAQGTGQHSFAALELAQNIASHPNMSKEEALQLIAGNQVMKQKDLDIQNYYNEAKDSYRKMYGDRAPQAYVLAHNILNAFRFDNSNDRYSDEKQALIDFYRKGTWKNNDGTISSITMPKDPEARDQIDQYYSQKFGKSKDLYRYVKNQ